MVRFKRYIPLIDGKVKMGKINTFLGLHGKQNNLLVQKEKLNFLLSKVLGKSVFMGNGMEKGTIIDTPYGLFYCRKNKNDLHIISPHYEFKELEVFKDLLKNSKIIFDVGAHIGKYSIMSSNLNPKSKVYAFEGERDNAKILSINKKINHLKNLQVINKALSNRIGKVKFYLSQTGLMTTKSNNFKSVETETIDNFLEKNKIGYIDLIKIDVDGSELDVLKGARISLSKGIIKNMIIEVSQETKKEVMGLFSRYGYSVSEVLYNNYLATK